MNKNIWIIVGLVIIVGLGLYISKGGDSKEMTKETSEQKMMDEKVANEEVNMEKDVVVDEKMIDKTEVMMKAGVYEAYSADKLARAETGDVVLFFHASWCPSCRGLNTNIESNSKSIPEGVSILKLDYDKETELKKKYGVTYQHTLVQVDKDGNMIKKWSGGGTLDSVLSQIQ